MPFHFFLWGLVSLKTPFHFLSVKKESSKESHKVKNLSVFQQKQKNRSMVLPLWTPTPILLQAFLPITEGKTSVILWKYGFFRELYLTEKQEKGFQREKPLSDF